VTGDCMTDRQHPVGGAGGGYVAVPELFFTRVMPELEDVDDVKAMLEVFRAIGGKGESRASVTCRQLQSSEALVGIARERLERVLGLAVTHGALLHSASTTGDRGEDSYSLAGSHGSIFALYEGSIGVITPMISEELKEAERLYPADWIEDAFREAVALNKRSWRYVARILERWAEEGKSSGKHRGRHQKDDPDKYVRGKYGHLVQR